MPNTQNQKPVSEKIDTKREQNVTKPGMQDQQKSQSQNYQSGSQYKPSDKR